MVENWYSRLPGVECGAETHTMILPQSEHFGDSEGGVMLGNRSGGGGGSWWAMGLMGRGEVALPPTMWLCDEKKATADGTITNNTLTSCILISYCKQRNLAMNVVTSLQSLTIQLKNKLFEPSWQICSISNETIKLYN